MKALSLLLISLFAGAAGTAASQQPICGGTSPYAEAQLARIRAIVSGTSDGADSLRVPYGLPATSSDSVQLVTNDSLGAVASRALRSTLRRTDAPIARLWVIRIGTTRYWVYDPRFRSAMDILHGVFDAA